MSSDRRGLPTWILAVLGPSLLAAASWFAAPLLPLRGHPLLIFAVAVVFMALLAFLAVLAMRMRRGAEALTEQEREEAVRFRSIMTHSLDGVWRVDADGNAIEVSPQMAAMLGREAHEIVGRHFLEFVPEDQRERALELFRRGARGESLQFDFRLLHRDGREVHTLVSSQPIMDADGRFQGGIGIVRDVTARQRSEQERSQAISLLEAALESTADGLLLVNAEGTIVRFNERFARMWRIPEDVLATHDDAKAVEFVVSQLLEPEQFLSKIRQLYADPDAESFDTLRFKDGRVFERYSIPQRQGERVVGRVWSFRDVTDRERAETAMRLALEREATIVQNIDAALFTFVLAHDGRLVRYEHFSQGAQALYGVSAEDLREDPSFWLRRVHPDDLRDIVRPALEGLLQMKKAAVEIRYESSRGLWRWHRTRLTPRPGPAPELIYVDGLEIDVTDRVALEEQLRHAQKMEAVGQLAGGIAHDFNNILTAILGYSDLILARSPKKDGARHYVEEIRKGGERAAALTRQLLAFSRRAATQPRTVDLNAALRDLGPMISRLVGENIAIALELSQEPAPVRIDPSQLEQVIVNLVVNARDAMPQGGSIRIRTEEIDGSTVEDGPREGESVPAAYQRLSVADTGSGIPADVRQHIFEPFYTTKDPGQGTGLGLATVYGIVQQNHGRIRVDSEEGRGTVFEILLPRAEGRSQPADGPVNIRGGNETILLVEDDAGLLVLGREVLAELGYVVLAARGGIEALELARRTAGKIDLVLTDVVMPQMGGRDLAMRLLEARPDVRVLFVSGYTPDVTLLHGVEEAEIPFLAKPYTPQTLAIRVREVLDAAPRSTLAADPAAGLR
jgi:PAS domain S-box-containing protein